MAGEGAHHGLAAEELERLIFFQAAKEQAMLEVKKNPKDVQALIRWGGALLELAHLKQGHESIVCIEQAVEKIEQALKIDPRKHEALWCLGNAYTSQVGFIGRRPPCGVACGAGRGRLAGSATSTSSLPRTLSSHPPPSLLSIAFASFLTTRDLSSSFFQPTHPHKQTNSRVSFTRPLTRLRSTLTARATAFARPSGKTPTTRFTRRLWR